MSKPIPELTLEDKIILIVIPVFVVILFITINIFTSETSVQKAFEKKLVEEPVGDAATILYVYPEPAPGTVSCRARVRSGETEFDFIYQILASDTIPFEAGKEIHFSGSYAYNENGGLVVVPYKGKKGKKTGWVMYEGKTYGSDNKSVPGQLPGEPPLFPGQEIESNKVHSEKTVPSLNNIDDKKTDLSDKEFISNDEVIDSDIIESVEIINSDNELSQEVED